MAALNVGICLAAAYCLLVLVVGSWGLPSGGRCGSPVDLVTRRVQGPATTRLPPHARRLQVSVRAERTERSGVVVARLWPADADQPKCTAVAANAFFCYKYTEIRWGLTDGRGSDHSINGKTSELELQHYLRRSDGELLGTPLAVAVLARPAHHHHHHHHTQRSMTELVKLLGNETRKMTLTLGELLPPEGQPYYQYSGTVPGRCWEETDWLVYEGEMEAPPQLLDCLRRHWTHQGKQAHFATVMLKSNLLYANQSIVPEITKISPRSNDGGEDPQQTVQSTSTVVTTDLEDLDQSVTPTWKFTPDLLLNSRQTEAYQDTQETEAPEDTRHGAGTHAGLETAEAPPNVEAIEAHLHADALPNVDATVHLHADVLSHVEAIKAHLHADALPDVEATEAHLPADALPDVEATEAHLHTDVLSNLKAIEAHLLADALPDVEATEAHLHADALPDVQATEAHLHADALPDVEATEAHLHADALPDVEATEAHLYVEPITDVELTEAPVVEALPDAEAQFGVQPIVEATEAHLDTGATASGPGTTTTAPVPPTVSEAASGPPEPLVATTSAPTTSTDSATTTDVPVPTTTEEPSSGAPLKPQVLSLTVILVILFWN